MRLGPSLTGLCAAALLGGCGQGAAPASSPASAAPASSPSSAAPVAASAKPSAGSSTAASASGSTGASAKPGAIAIKSAYTTTSATMTPLWAAKDGGYFDQQGLNVTLARIEAGAQS